jgi:pSer/pThr/pTyr-binding forkhead associated (FHA) protein
MRLLLRIQAPDAPALEEVREVAARLLVGRSPACDLVLEDRRVSNRHLLIEVVDGRLYAVDQESANGTRVRRGGGELSATPRVPLALQTGDILRVGRVELSLRPVVEDEPAPTQEMVIPDGVPVLDPADLIEEIEEEVAFDDLTSRRDVLRARLAAQEAEERGVVDQELAALQARLAEGQTRLRAAEEGISEAARRAETIVAQAMARRREAERLDAERVGLEAAAEAAMERALRLEARLEQVRGELAEARTRQVELQRVLPGLQSRYTLLAERQRLEMARSAARRRGES